MAPGFGPPRRIIVPLWGAFLLAAAVMFYWPPGAGADERVAGSEPKVATTKPGVAPPAEDIVAAEETGAAADRPEAAQRLAAKQLFDTEDFLPTRPTAEDRRPASAAERQQLFSFLRERLPDFHAYMQRHRRSGMGSLNEAIARLRVLRRLWDRDEEVAKVFAAYVQSEHQIRLYSRVLTMLPEESRAAVVAKEELREQVSRQISAERAWRVARMRYVRKRLADFVEYRVDSMVRGTGPESLIQEYREMARAVRVERDPERRAVLRAQLSDKLTHVSATFFEQLEKRLERQAPPSDAEIDRRMRQVQAAIERAGQPGGDDWPGDRSWRGGRGR